MPILPPLLPSSEGSGVGFQNGPCPMQLVVVSAVMAAVSIATSTSTALRLISAQAFSRRVSKIFTILIYNLTIYNVQFISQMRYLAILGGFVRITI